MQIFISHASEDKDEFVRPLAAELKKAFSVWYDEYELTIGDSLLGKINAGLASSDYGVVVLSPAFFAKKWPQAELDGLFALERTTKKMILPVWKDIDAERVAKHSAILAGRLASLASKGVSVVVADIIRAVGVAERSRELSQLDGLTTKFKALDSTLQMRSRAEERLRTREGVVAIQDEFIRACVALEQQLGPIGESSTLLKFRFEWLNERTIFEIRGPFLLRLNLHLSLRAYNTATDALLHCIVYTAASRTAFEDRGEPTKLETFSFAPYFGESGEVVWTSPNSREKASSTEQLLTKAIGAFYMHLERASKS